MKSQIKSLPVIAIVVVLSSLANPSLAVPYSEVTTVEGRGLGDDAANALQRVWEGIKCLGDCRKSWGWTGNHFGGDPWGGVLKIGDPEPYSDSGSGNVSNAASNPNANSSSSTAGRGGLGIQNVQSTTTATTITAPTVQFSVFDVPTLIRSSSTSTPIPTPTSTPPPPPPSSEEPSPTPEPQPEPSSEAQPDPAPTQNEQPANTIESVDTTTNNNNNNNNNVNQGATTNNNNAFSGDRQQYLDAHNAARSAHGASAVTWSDQLEGFAQEWANNCQFKHSAGKFGRVGENLAAGTGTYTIPQMVNDWVVEVSDYNPSNPKASHFTQVVWKATSQIGCAKATCNGIFDAPATYYVCEYLEAGNVIGNFAANVQV
ncbi:hypothetical protein FRC20_010902 [Serendipita sp. 405]|nr:hypothetical protein FRC20_010902 [Serendipita sp. 405]